MVEGARVFCAFTREWLEGDVAVADGRFAGVGVYEGGERIDGARALPRPRVHRRARARRVVASSRSREFARRACSRAARPTIVCDPHELANVLGTEGVHWLLDACEGLPLDVFVMAPVVRAGEPVRVAAARRSRSATWQAILRRAARARRGRDDELPGRHRRRRRRELAKLALADGAHVDGHAPGVIGPRLDAYLAAGIATDHEATDARGGAGEAPARRCGC